MYIKKVLEAFPPIEIDIPLPQMAEDQPFPEDGLLLPIESSWNKAELEWALGVVATAAMRNNAWCILDTDAFVALVTNEKAPWYIFSQRVINATWELADRGYLEIVTVNGRDYLVPNRSLAEELAKCHYRLVSGETPIQPDQTERYA